VAGPGPSRLRERCAPALPHRYAERRGEPRPGEACTRGPGRHVLGQVLHRGHGEPQRGPHLEALRHDVTEGRQHQGPPAPERGGPGGPGPVGIVDRDLLEGLAASLPGQPVQKGTGPRGQKIDLRSWLTGHGIGIAGEKPYGGGTLFVLDECPFSGEHRDGAFAIQFGSGAIYAGCHHASCGGGSQRWQELREKYEPREKRSVQRGSEDKTENGVHGHHPNGTGKDLTHGGDPSKRSRESTSKLPGELPGREEALAVLQHGDPKQAMLRAFALDHEGDEVVAECLVMSLASRSVINTNGLHVSVSGESGKGKSHNHNHDDHQHDSQDQAHHSPDHPGHTDGHHDHSHHLADFQKRFWVSLFLSVPVLLLSEMIQQWLGFSFRLPFHPYILFALSAVIFFYGGWPFLSGAIDELRSRQPGMMTLIGMAITVAFVYSSATVFFIRGHDFFWELATLIVIMLLGHWVEAKSVLGASASPGRARPDHRRPPPTFLARPRWLMSLYPSSSRATWCSSARRKNSRRRPGGGRPQLSQRITPHR